jgi:hypothetical protein
MNPSKRDLPEQPVDAFGKFDPTASSTCRSTWTIVGFGMCPRSWASLSHIPGIATIYEREPQAGPQSDEAPDLEEDLPDCHGESRSSLVLPVAADKRFQFETDILEPDEGA